MSDFDNPRQFAGPVTPPTAEELADRHAVSQLVKIYALGIDTRDYALARSVFADNAVALGTAGEGKIDDYLPKPYGAAASFATTQHNITNQYIAIDGDQAMVWSYAIAYHFDSLDKKREDIIVGVTYRDQCRRDPQGWLISERRVTMHWNQGALP